jgi:hypothetical protein
VLRISLALLNLFLVTASLSRHPAFAEDSKTLAECIEISIKTEAPVSGFVDRFLSDPENIGKILGEPAEGKGPAFLVPARRAFEFLNFRTENLKPEEKVLLWKTLAAELHRRYPSWTSRGPFRTTTEGSYAFQGGLGISLIIRARDGKMFVGRTPFLPLKGWDPDYLQMETLDDFLRKRREAAEKKDTSE